MGPPAKVLPSSLSGGVHHLRVRLRLPALPRLWSASRGRGLRRWSCLERQQPPPCRPLDASKVSQPPSTYRLVTTGGGLPEQEVGTERTPPEDGQANRRSSSRGVARCRHYRRTTSLRPRSGNCSGRRDRDVVGALWGLVRLSHRGSAPRVLRVRLHARGNRPREVFRGVTPATGTSGLPALLTRFGSLRGSSALMSDRGRTLVVISLRHRERRGGSDQGAAPTHVTRRPICAGRSILTLRDGRLRLFVTLSSPNHRLRWVGGRIPLPPAVGAALSGDDGHGDGSGAESRGQAGDSASSSPGWF